MTAWCAGRSAGGRGRKVTSGVLWDARELAGDQEVEADVCIVGAGPAGISIARELVGNGSRVWLLDSGGSDVERRAQRLNRGQSAGYPIHRLHQSRVRAFWAVRPRSALAWRLLDVSEADGKLCICDRISSRWRQAWGADS